MTPGTSGIAVVHYRNYGDLTRCLASIAAAEPTAPVVVVDHASDAAALSKVRAEFPAVAFYDTPHNPGFAAGANRAIRALGTSRVLLVNPDCVLHGAVARHLADVLDRTADTGVVGPRVLNADGSVQPSARRFPDVSTALAGRRSWLTAVLPGNRLSKRNLLTGTSEAGPRTVDWVSGACMMISRDAFDAVDGFDESYFLYWEDADLCRRLLTRGIRTIYDPGVVVTHVGARCSRFNARTALVAFHVSALRYFHRHAGAIGKAATPVVALLLGGRMIFGLSYQAIAGWLGRGDDPDPAVVTSTAQTDKVGNVR